MGRCLGKICGLEGLRFRKITLMQCGRLDGRRGSQQTEAIMHIQD